MTKTRKGIFTLIAFIVLILTIKAALGYIEIGLNSPADTNYYTNSDMINFTYTPTTNESFNASECTLVLWNSTAQYTNYTNRTLVSNGTLNFINITIPQDNNYTWNYYCTNNASEYNYSASNRTITVDGTAPYVNYTASSTSINEGDSVNFDSSASTDAVSGIFNYTWNFADQWEAYNTATPSFQFNDSGIFTVNLTMKDYLNNTNSTNVTFTVAEVNPIANISTGTLTINEGQSILFNATNSTGNTGDALNGTYTWDFSYDGVTFNEEAGTTDANITKQFNTSGNFNVSVMVFDEDGNDTAYVQVTINEVNPTAALSGNVTSINEGQWIRLDASNSTDNVGDNFNGTYLWDFSYDGSTFNTDAVTSDQNVSYQFNTSGAFNVSVMVFDEDGNDTALLNISVAEVDPLANISGNVSTINEGQWILFNATNSTGNVGDDLNTTYYQWDFSYDGATFIPEQNTTVDYVSHQFNTSGNYNVSVKVFDEDGNNMTFMPVVINEVDPTAALSGNTSVINEGQFILLNATNSTGNVGDELNTTFYLWDFSYDGATFNAEENTSVGYVTHQFNTSGLFNVSVMVFDEDTNDTALFNISVAEVDPLSVIFANVTTINEGAYVLFNASNSTGNVGDDLNTTYYQWDFSYDGATFIPEQNTTVDYVSHQFTENMTYNVSLRVFDEDGSNVSYMQVVVNDINPQIDLSSFAINDTVAENANGVVNDITFHITAPLNYSWDPIVGFDWDTDGNGSYDVIGGNADYTTNYNVNGTYTVIVRARDEDSSSTDTLNITVTYVNDRPQYGPLADQTVVEDGSIVIPLLANATDEEDASVNLTHSCVSNESNVVLSYENVGKNLTITANNSYIGSALINCTVTDLGAMTNATSFVVDVTAVNDAPTLDNFTSFAATEDSLQVMNLSANMSDADNATSQLSLNTNSTFTYGNGTTLVFNYTNLSANYTDWIVMNVTDGLNTSASQLVQINVTYVNDNPVIATLPNRDIAEDSTGNSYNISSYVSDEEGHVTLFGISTENTSEVDCAIVGDNITLTPASDWYGTGANAAQCGVYAYENVSGLTSNVATFSINVLQVDDNLTFNGTINNQTWNEDSNTTYDLSQNFNNIDGDAITYGTLNVTQNVTLSFSGDTVTFIPNSNWYGSEWVTINATDGSSNVQSNAILLTVNSVNDAPTLTIAPQIKAEDTGSYQINLTTGANDVENNSLTYYVTGEDASKVDCSVSGELLNYTLQSNYFGNTSCAVVASDGSANSTAANFTIQITNVDDAPVFSGPIANLTWAEDTQTTIDMDTYFSELDGENLSYEVVLANNMSYTVDNSTGIVTLTPDANFYGTSYAVFNATDGISWTASNNVTLTVTAVNDDAPVVDFTGLSIVIDEDSYNATINLSDYVADADTADENINWSRMDTNANVVVSIDQTTKIMNISGIADWNGVAAIILNATDGNLSDYDSFTLTVNPVADSPVITPIGNQTVSVGNTLSLNVAATDGDGDTLTYSDDTSLFDINSATGAISYTPNASQVGTYTITITVNDGTGRTDTDSFNLTVNNLNNAPDCNVTIPAETWAEDNANNNAFDLDDYCFDADGDTLTYTASTADNTNIDVTIGTGNVVSFSQPADWDGAEAVVFTASDGQANDTTNSVTLTVTGTNDNPTSVTYAPTEDPRIAEDGSADLSVTIVDPDSTPTVAWTVNGTPATTGNSFTFNAASYGGAGTYTVVATVTDGSYTNSNTWTIIASAVPIADTFDGDTTNFSAIPDLSNAVGVVLDKSGIGRIEFTTSVDLSDVVDFDNCVRIEGDVIGIDTTCLPSLANEPANIRLRNVNYNSRPSLYYDSGFDTARADIDTECTFCSLTDFDPAPQSSGIVDFSVEHFTVFTAKDSDNFTGRLEVNDIEVRVDGDKISGIDDDGGDIDDDVFPGSEIEIEIELENTYDEDDDIDIEDIDLDAVLYDIDDGDDLDEDADISRIRAGDKETVTITFTIPDEVEEDDYELVIDIEGLDDLDQRHTLELNFDVSVEKKNEDVRISRADLTRDIVSCSRTSTFEYRLFNAGEDDDEDVRVEVSSSALGVSYIKSGITLDSDPDDDNAYSGTVPIEVPSTLGSGTYPITMRVYYGDDSEAASVTKQMGVQDCFETEQEEGETIDVEVIPSFDEFEDPFATEVVAGDEVDFMQSSTYGMVMAILIILAVGFIIFEIGVVYYGIKKAAKKKRK